MEEQKEGARANDKKKSLMGGPLSELDAKGEGRLKHLSFIVSGRYAAKAPLGLYTITAGGFS